jgi:hypothetical protein
MNRKGQIVFTLPEDMIAQGDFHDGRAQVFCVRSQLVRTRIGQETIEQTEDVSARGYIDTASKLVIPPRFSRVQDFSDGLAVVKVGKGLPIDYYNITPEREKEYADREAKYYSCINRGGVIIIERCGDPLPYDEQVSRFPFGEAFGRGFVDGLYFNKTHVGQRTVYGYQDKTGKYVWIQPHGEGVVLPTSWR